MHEKYSSVYATRLFTLNDWSGLNVKSLGTLGYYINQKKISETILTTPEKEELHQLSHSSSSEKVEFVFEVSSHGISKNRIKNLPINIAAITNITQDHLDYHKTFINYKNAKFKIFLKYLLKRGIAIVNDNINGINDLKQKLNKRNVNIITYGKNTSNINCLYVKNICKIKVLSKIYPIKFYVTNNFELEIIEKHCVFKHLTKCTCTCARALGHQCMRKASGKRTAHAHVHAHSGTYTCTLCF